MEKLLQDAWIIEFIGRFHPLLVHFPIGLLFGAFALEFWSSYKNQDRDYRPVLYLGTIGAVFAALMGQFLFWTGAYQGELLDNHQTTGILTAVLSLIASYTYWKKDKFPSFLPLLLLGVLCISTGIAGHFGASITHGEDYLTGAFPDDQAPSSEKLAQFVSWKNQDSLSTQQLDKLNLEVRAIFAHKCYQCHSTAKRKGGLSLDDRDALFEGGEGGPVLVSGSSGQSEIIRRLRLPRSNEEAMPPKGKLLSKAEIDLIALWIDKGAHWADQSLKIFREAPMALGKVDLPTSTKFKHPIDKFLDKYFQENGIEWPDLIDDRRFIRRAYLDIVGLIPPADKVDAFLKNSDENKREALIHDLLADSQNYSLHWLSFWNDLLRNDYSGTGFITGGRKKISDWLYTSLQESKPYNQMVQELIDPTPASEGFIKGIKWRGVVNSSQQTELQAAQNVSQSLLGLNLKCASCHDSFVNNVSLDQAYGFAQIFADTALEVHRCDKPTGRFAQTAFIYPELGEVEAESIKERLEQLSTIIIQPQNGRLYRTLVNRYWDKLFGRGIVTPVDEMDNLPWNQELLDWLAADFIEQGYQLPKLLARIMTSRAFQLEAFPYPSQNYISSEDFVFRGPLARRLSAEQFADAFSQLIQPLYHGAAFIPGNPAYPAKWIWYRDKAVGRDILPKPGTRYFRKEININRRDKPISATILITADHSFDLYFNEKKIGTGDNWRKTRKIDLAPGSIQKRNILAIKAQNEGDLPNPAGVLFALRIQFPGGKEQIVYSDKSWLSFDENPEGSWTSSDYIDTAWQKVVARSSSSYWGKLLDFNFDEKYLNVPFLRASLVEQNTFMKTLGRPTRENVATKRDENATLLQALMLSNNESLHENISLGAKQWIENYPNESEQLIEALYTKMLSRNPTQKELRFLLDKIKNGPAQEALEDLIWVLLLSPEFQLI